MKNEWAGYRRNVSVGKGGETEPLREMKRGKKKEEGKDRVTRWKVRVE